MNRAPVFVPGRQCGKDNASSVRNQIIEREVEIQMRNGATFDDALEWAKKVAEKLINRREAL